VWSRTVWGPIDWSNQGHVTHQNKSGLTLLRPFSAFLLIRINFGLKYSIQQKLCFYFSCSVRKTMETILNATLAVAIPGGRQNSLSPLPCELFKTAFKLNVIHCKCLEIVNIPLIQSVWFTLFRSVATSRFDCLFYPDLVCFKYSPRPYSRVVRDLRIGPNCLGSPASTSWPPLGWLGSRRSATGMIHSGSVACPASSMKMWLKWLRGNFAETNLGTKKDGVKHYDSTLREMVVVVGVRGNRLVLFYLFSFDK